MATCGGQGWLTWLLLAAVVCQIAMEKETNIRHKREVESTIDLNLNSDFKRIKRDGEIENDDDDDDDQEIHRFKRFKRNVRVKRQDDSPDEPPAPSFQEDFDNEPMLFRLKRDLDVLSEPDLQRVKRAKRHVDVPNEPDLQRVKRAKRHVEVPNEPDLQRVKRAKRHVDVPNEPDLQRVKRAKRHVDVPNEPDLQRVKRAKRAVKSEEADNDPELERVKRFKRNAQKEKPNRLKRTKNFSKKNSKKSLPVAASKHLKKRMSSLPKRHHAPSHKDVREVVAKAMDIMHRNGNKRHMVLHRNIVKKSGVNLHRKKRNGEVSSKSAQLERDMMRLKRLKREINHNIHQGMKKLHDYDTAAGAAGAAHKRANSIHHL